jgi:hypothetical protein
MKMFQTSFLYNHAYTKLQPQRIQFFNKLNMVNSGISGKDLAVICTFTPKTNLTYRHQVIVPVIMIRRWRIERIGHIIDLVITGLI